MQNYLNHYLACKQQQLYEPVKLSRNRPLVKTRRSWGRDKLVFSVLFGILKQNGRAFGIEEPYYSPVVSSVAVYVLLSLVLAPQRSSTCRFRAGPLSSLNKQLCFLMRLLCHSFESVQLIWTNFVADHSPTTLVFIVLRLCTRFSPG